MAAKRLIPLREVLARTSVSKTRLYQLLKQGQFPRQLRVSPGRVAWVSSEVERWIEERIAER